MGVLQKEISVIISYVIRHVSGDSICFISGKYEGTLINY
jgi:hypothetical protein